MKNEVFYVTGKPWKECPFDCPIVVATKNGPDEAIKLWREFYHNEALEPLAPPIPVPFIKGEIDESAAA
jgi:hypothetical protein